MADENPLHILIQYCSSWGYRNAFVKFAQMLKDYYPEATVVGDTYPPGAIQTLLAQLCQFIFFFGLALLFASDFVGNALPFVIIQNLCNYIKNNKMQTFFVIFLCNTFGSSLLSTGAFEVYCNNHLIFSKLATGELPNVQFLLQEIAKLA